jgi:thioredoxin
LSNPQLIDVRTSDEFQLGHLKHARLISINNSDFEKRLLELDKTKPVFVYCLSGGRSSSAASLLRKKGFGEVYEMPGYMAWINAGKEVETSESANHSSNVLTTETYFNLVNKPGYVLVDFSATWCQPCKIIAPVLDQVAKDYHAKLQLIKLDADEQLSLCEAKGINGIPYLELYNKGKLIWTHKGIVTAAELTQQLK